MAKAYRVTDKSAIQYMQSLKDNNTQLKNGQTIAQGYTQALKGATAGQKALSMGMKMLSSIGWALAVSLALKGLTMAYEAVFKAQEKAVEKAENALSKINESADALKSNKQTIDSISTDYHRLAQGVDDLGRNVSLTTEQYSQYNNITNQIADMFPQLIQGYTAEGNAIIKNKGKVEELTKAYREQKKAYLDTVIIEGGDVYKGFKSTIDPYFDSFGKKNEKELLSDLMDGFIGNDTPDEFYKQLKDKWGGLITNSTSLRDVASDASIETHWYDNNIDIIKRMLSSGANLTKLRSRYSAVISEINAETAKVKPVAQAYMEKSYEYQKLDSGAKDLVSQMVNQFDYEFYRQFDSDTKMQAWIDEHLLKPLSGTNGKDIPRASLR